MADAPDGDEADGDGLEGELDNMDPTVVKEHMKKLDIERERQKELTERLQVKLKVLNGELAARKEEVERIRQEQEKLHRDKKMSSEMVLKQRGEDEGGGKMDTQNELQRLEKVRKVIEEEVLQGAGKKRSAKNESGFRMYDEMELMVEKPAEEQKMEATYIDTVLITLIKAMTEERFYLTYRVDKYMTCKKLREDACLYWQISEVEYILKTVTNSKLQDDVTVQNAFDRQEDAHLLLLHKNPQKTTIEASEENAIAPKSGKLKKKKKQTEQAESANDPAKASGSDFYEQMDVLPGFKEFMTQREDPNVNEHVKTIRLQSILLYLCMGACTIASIVHMRPPVMTYIMYLGSTSNLIMPRLDQTTHTEVPDFYTIRSNREAWMWLETTLPNYVFNQSLGLRKQNLALGFLSVRMQQVKPPSPEACISQGKICLYSDYNEKTAGTEDLSPLKDLWTGRPGLDGRAESPVGLPWKFRSAKEMEEETKGVSQSTRHTTFDASGYTLVYNMQFGNGTLTQQAFKNDMALLQSQGWIGPRTRAVHVHFTLYNGNYDFWLSNWYTLGIPASGIIQPSLEAQIYRPTFTDFQQGTEQAGIDIARGILVFYMFTFHFYMELGPEKSCASILYRCGCSGGFFDVCIFGIFLYIVIVRYLIYGLATEDATVVANQLREKFINDQSWARTYDFHILAEAGMLFFIVIRWLYYMRINRHIFVISTSIWHAFRPYVFFLLVLVPVLIAFTVMGHTIYRSDLEHHRTAWGSFTSTLMMLCGDYEAVKVRVAERPWTLIFLINFYVFVNLLLVNSWIAAVVSSYQQVRVGFGYNPNDHQWTHEQYINWVLPSPLAKLYLRLYDLLKVRRAKKKHEKDQKDQRTSG